MSIFGVKRASDENFCTRTFTWVAWIFRCHPWSAGAKNGMVGPHAKTCRVPALVWGERGCLLAGSKRKENMTDPTKRGNSNVPTPSTPVCAVTQVPTAGVGYGVPGVAP